MQNKIIVQDIKVSIKEIDKMDYVSLTDIARSKNPNEPKDIASEFASWISAEFKLFLIKEFQRLKNDEIDKQQLGWDIKRTIVKMNYHIHTDAIKNNYSCY